MPNDCSNHARIVIECIINPILKTQTVGIHNLSTFSFMLNNFSKTNAKTYIFKHGNMIEKKTKKIHSSVFLNYSFHIK